MTCDYASDYVIDYLYLKLIQYLLFMVCPVGFLESAVADNVKYDMASRLTPLLAALCWLPAWGARFGTPTFTCPCQECLG